MLPLIRSGRPFREGPMVKRYQHSTSTQQVLGLVAAAAAGLGAPAAAQPVHLLEAGPRTVAYGYYWSEAKPVLRIKSGDIIDVTTMSTSNPASLERAGVAPSDIPQAHRAIMDSVTDRGPGGHILTGPV